MNKEVWFGSKNNSVGFSENREALEANGYDNPQSFVVTGNGDIQGLNLIGTAQTSTQNAQQPQG